MGKHAYGPPSDMDPETTICMRKIFEAIEDARLRGESDTSSLHYKRHTKLKAKNALSHSQSVDSIESFGSRPEFVVRSLGTTASPGWSWWGMAGAVRIRLRTGARSRIRTPRMHSRPS